MASTIINILPKTIYHRRSMMLRSLRSARRCTGLVLAGLLLACMAGQGVASPIYDTSAVRELTGTRTEGAGLTTGGAYATDRSAFTMSWVITPLGGDTFHYQYTFDGFNPTTSLECVDQIYPRRIAVLRSQSTSES